MGVMEGCRHQIRRLAAGIAKHNALVARALILIASRIDANGNIGRLRMEQHFNIGILPMEAFLLIANVANGEAGDMGNVISGQRLRTTGFACDHDAIGGGERLASHADLPGIDALSGAFAEEGIHDFVRNPVTHLIGMAFGDRFTGE